MEEEHPKRMGSNCIPGNPRLGLSHLYFGINRSCDGNALRAKKFPEFRMADAQYVDGKPSGI